VTTATRAQAQRLAIDDDDNDDDERQLQQTPATVSTTLTVMSPLPSFLAPERVIIPLTFQWPVKFCFYTTLTTYVLSIFTGNVSQVDRRQSSASPLSRTEHSTRSC
jgi:hypothetical protein